MACRTNLPFLTTQAEHKDLWRAGDALLPKGQLRECPSRQNGSGRHGNRQVYCRESLTEACAARSGGGSYAPAASTTASGTRRRGVRGAERRTSLSAALVSLRSLLLSLSAGRRGRRRIRAPARATFTGSKRK